MTEANIPVEQDNTEADAGSVEILEHRDARAEGVPLFVAHWHIFLPTIIILVTYSLAWMFLALTGKSDTAIARLFIVVVAMGVPLLAGHAFLRFQTIRLQVNEENILCHPGWPKDMPINVPLGIIDEVTIKRGLYGQIFDGGTVVIHLTTHNQIVVTDLRNPEDAVTLVELAISEYKRRKK